jgi:regulator of nucleoside diphosphate kinase
MATRASLLFRNAPILITRGDQARLRALVDRHLDGPEAAAAEQLEGELERATVLNRYMIPDDVVTMRSVVTFEDVATGEQLQATLVYPSEADVAQGKISVLAPVGMALLGLKVGQQISWPIPGGRARTLRVLAVPYQPEAAGDLDL